MNVFPIKAFIIRASRIKHTSPRKGNSMFRVLKRLILLVLIVSVMGCASGVKQLETINRVVDENKRTSVAKINSLSEDIRELKKINSDLTGKLNRLSSDINKLAQEINTIKELHSQEIQELSNHITLLSDQLIRMEKKGFRPAGKTTIGSAVFRPDAYETSASYRAARDDYEAGKYDQALGEFMEILAIAPKSALADNAQYWIGECYYGLGNYLQALSEFEKVFAFEESDKKPDSQLKIALCYLKLNDSDRTARELNKVIDRYPASEAAKKAKVKITQLKK